MTSGIYQLTFPNGKTYVGKSVNVEQRWQQHADKLAKGTAAKNMQQAGRTFNARVLLEVHPDFLDEYEGYFINRLKPELNTQVPEYRSDYSIMESWADLGNQREPATFAFNQAITYAKCYKDTEAIANAAITQLRAVGAKWDDKVHMELCKNDKFSGVGEELAELKKYKQRVEACGWWDRLWKAW